MSIVPKDTVQVIAQTIGITSLNDEVALALAPDVEYRIREVIQEAIKCMRHSKRAKLSTDDVNAALSLRSIEPLYGFSSTDPLRFRKALGHSDLYYVDDRELDFHEIIEAPIPPVPLEPYVRTHWLAIEGVQPAIPENPPVRLDAALEVGKRKKDEAAAAATSAAAPADAVVNMVETKPAVKHVLSKELQLYFEKVTELIITNNRSPAVDLVLQGVATDAGIHPLVPYFALFISDEVTRGLDDINLLFCLMKLSRCLLLNPHIHIDLYLHQLMPSILTCLMAGRLGRDSLGHWELRDFSAKLIASICRSHGQTYESLQPRVTRTLLVGFLDTKKSLPQHYGAIMGLYELGPRTVKVLLLPNLAQYLKFHFQGPGPDSWKKEARSYEATRVYQALQIAVGACLHQELKGRALVGGLVISDGAVTWGSNARCQNAAAGGGGGAAEGSSSDRGNTNKRRVNGRVFVKRKRAEDEWKAREGRPGADRSGGAMGETSVAERAYSMDVWDVEERPALEMGSTVGGGSSHRDTDMAEASEEVVVGVVDGSGVVNAETGSSGRRPHGEGKDAKEPASKVDVLSAAWKEDVDVGALMVSIVELMGDGMLPFVPHPSLAKYLL